MNNKKVYFLNDVIKNIRRLEIKNMVENKFIKDGWQIVEWDKKGERDEQ